MGFSSEDIDNLYRGLEEALVGLDKITGDYACQQFSPQRAEEFAKHGFLRRIKTLRRSLKRIFELLPPERSDIPSDDVRNDAEIYLQAFIFNLFGCVDNLAHIWVHVKNVIGKDGMLLSPKSVGLRANNAAVRKSLPIGLRVYLESLDGWFALQENYRHALAHRIPPYIPPYVISEERMEEYRFLGMELAEAFEMGDYEKISQISEDQEALGTFVPLVAHSFIEESKPIVLHPQIIADAKSVIEIATRMLEEICATSKTPP